MRVEVERAVARDHDLAVERRVGRQQLAERRAARGSSGAAAGRSASRAQLAAVVLEHAAEPVPLRLVLPAVAGGSSRRARASIGGNGTFGPGTSRRLLRPRAQPEPLSSADEACRRHRARRRDARSATTCARPGSRPSPGGAAIDFIRAFDASDSPCGSPREVKGFDPTDGRLGEGGAEARPQRPARARGGAGGGRRRGARRRLRPGARRHPLRHRDRRLRSGSWSRHEVLRERGPDRVSPIFLPNVLVDAASGQLAISLGYRGPNYAPVSACATGSTAVGESAEMIRRGDADAMLAGGAEACMHPLILAGFCAMRGLSPRTSTRRARRARSTPRAPASSWARAPACSCSRSSSARGARRPDLRRGDRLRRVQRRVPHGAARARGDRGRGR